VINPIEGFRGDYHPALRLHHDKHGGHHAARLWQLELHRDAESE
jgi:hypothetical protein